MLQTSQVFKLFLVAFYWLSQERGLWLDDWFWKTKPLRITERIQTEDADSNINFDFIIIIVILFYF